MVTILVALTFVVAILAKAIIHHPAQKREVVRVKPEREWMIISPTALMPEGLRA
jgi:hypothetical protein